MAAGYVELQSQFAERFFVVSNVRIDDNDAFGDHTTNASHRHSLCWVRRRS